MSAATKVFHAALIRLGKGLLSEWETWLKAQGEEPKKP